MVTTLCHTKHENSSIIRKYEIHTKYQKHSTELAAAVNSGSISQWRQYRIRREFIYGTIEATCSRAL